MKSIDQVNLGEKDRQAIDEAVQLLYQSFSIEQIILYGSKARGMDDAESDIDLLLLTSEELDWKGRNAITDALYDIQLTHGVVISTLVVPIHEWTQGRYTVLPIHDEIERYGVAA